ncbi:glycosyltransferase family 2 protein [Pseudoalteromonas nigrifaciens]|uniref:glycosyltransferase family 2 protein n=1 Tax=Pseudoalteromonas nigrifaciens TaxID=28109 RepID=UPI0017880985|nr:glycosyltransferase family 2 protein [Pseudoalteromonas nigrifaciens]MBE0421295.1 glycosyltransferase family 2 protein [Pseudoalteromonas nigrifaciens]
MSLVSIIMPAYNAEKTIKKSIVSIQNQTYGCWELLVTDDNSTDATRSIVLELAKSDERIKYFPNKGKSGAWSARNNSIKVAEGEYIAFLDSDDTWLPQKLTMQISEMKTKNVNASHSTYYRVLDTGKVIGIKKASQLVTLNDMLKKNCIGNLTGIYNAKILGKFYQQEVGHEDYAMWLEVLKSTDSVGIELPMANYLVTTNSLSSNKFKAALWHFNLLRSHKKVGAFSIWYYFCCYIVSSIKSRV